MDTVSKKQAHYDRKPQQDRAAAAVDARSTTAASVGRGRLEGRAERSEDARVLVLARQLGRPLHFFDQSQRSRGLVEVLKASNCCQDEVLDHRVRVPKGSPGSQQGLAQERLSLPESLLLKQIGAEVRDRLDGVRVIVT